METSYLVRINAPLPVVSFVVSMLLLLLAKSGKKDIALAACAIPPVVLGTYFRLQNWDAAVVPAAVFFGLIPAAVLAVGIHMWCAPTRPGSATRALAKAAACGLLPSAVTFYAFIATDCIHKTNGGCDDPLFWLGSAVVTSWSLGVVLSALVSRGRAEPLPWELSRSP